MSTLDILFTAALDAARTAVLDVGAFMAVLMLGFGILDWKYGDRVRDTIRRRRLDRPELGVALALIPVDGTLLFQYETYRKKNIRFGTLLAGMIGIGEEATYLILAYNPVYWLILAGVKLVAGTAAGRILNGIPPIRRRLETLRSKDASAGLSDKLVEADRNFHGLPDRYRHRLHQFRYHRMGTWFWVLSTAMLGVSLLVRLLNLILKNPVDGWTALGIPLLQWGSLLVLLCIAFYAVVVHLVTNEFGKIVPEEFEDSGDSAGDLAELCARIILLIFLVSFAVEALIGLIGMDTISGWLAGNGHWAIFAGAVLGLIPGTAPTLAFTTIFLSLRDTPGALPFAALLACSIALIGDAQFIGSSTLRHTQRAAHILTFLIALLVGFGFHVLFPEF